MNSWEEEAPSIQFTPAFVYYLIHHYNVEKRVLRFCFIWPHQKLICDIKKYHLTSSSGMSTLNCLNPVNRQCKVKGYLHALYMYLCGGDFTCDMLIFCIEKATLQKLTLKHCFQKIQNQKNLNTCFRVLKQAEIKM
ncbi:Hypothetical predicted protein [Podarcis lilfordi]|uniref:Uncharacterized protein n=1 Tax=Podarcis lilfordi TaxID=74358 RepID=A0AA35PGM6_9SAUR|nr:Hypothetical predicted protein [Podarcis lilfordi]